MKGEWNEETIPSVEEFMEKINKFRSNIVDLTEKIEDTRQEILILKEELANIEPIKN